MSRSLSKMKHYFNGFNYLGAGLSDSNNPRESSIIESFRNVNQHAYKSLNHLKNEMNDKFINKNLSLNKEDGSSVRLAIQLNENHHYYPEENDTLFPVGEVDHLHNLDPKYVDKFFEILKSEQDASIQNTKDTHRLEFYGLLGGVGLCIALMLCGIYALSIDESWIAGIIFGTTIVAISTILFLKKEWKHKPPNTTDDEKL